MAQLVEHALRKQKVMGSSPGGCFVSSGSFRFHSGSVSGLALLTSLANAFARKLAVKQEVLPIVWSLVVQSKLGQGATE